MFKHVMLTDILTGTSIWALVACDCLPSHQFGRVTAAVSVKRFLFFEIFSTSMTQAIEWQDSEVHVPERHGCVRSDTSHSREYEAVMQLVASPNSRVGSRPLSLRNDCCRNLTSKSRKCKRNQVCFRMNCNHFSPHTRESQSHRNSFTQR